MNMELLKTVFEDVKRLLQKKVFDYYIKGVYVDPYYMIITAEKRGCIRDGCNCVGSWIHGNPGTGDYYIEEDDLKKIKVILEKVIFEEIEIEKPPHPTKIRSRRRR